jgi:membrane-associated phospholipid phosphatase
LRPARPGFLVLSFARLDQIADLVNPALTLWALLLLWRRAREARAGGETFPLGRTITAWFLCVLTIYVVAHLNRWLGLWPGHRLFPSGHTSYAACFVTLGALLDRRSLALTVPLLGLYGVLIVRMGYHVWIDIVGALAFAPPLTLWLAHRMRAASTWAPRGAGARWRRR